jgi:hypothetical protein
MTGLYDCDIVTRFLLDFKLEHPIFAVINLMIDYKERREFTSKIFTNAIEINWFCLAVKIFGLHQPTIIDSSE